MPVATPLFLRFAEVIIPGGFEGVLTYGIPESLAVTRGSVVLVPLGRRKEAQLALVTHVHGDIPKFPVKPLTLHPSAFCFNERFLDAVEWCARFYCTSVNLSLDLFWPTSLPEWLQELSDPSTRKRKFVSLAPTEPAMPPPLTEEQASAVAQLAPMLQGTGFRGALLHGVTGSGKTRVYLELVQKALQQGQRILILVPEIALTPQTRDRFQAYLREDVLLLHSNLSSPERRNTWLQLLRGDARIVMGTRSALLAPGYAPGIIIIDEEHDSSYKQQDPSPRYHCRELAFHIAHRHGAMVLLGTATPSLETWEYAQRGHLALVCLKQRARPVPLPQVRIVDLKKEVHQDRALQLSPALREALCDCVAQGKQAIVLHNRRGFATSRVCTQCGDILHCDNCQVPVVLHRQHAGLLCHYCGRLYPAQRPCTHCGSTQFTFEGGAIEQVEEEIQAWVPGALIARLDRDSVQRIGAAEKVLSAFRAGEFNILLGTQMVAKGHDFPGVQLVGVVAADTGSALPDFRSSERTFQLLTQVAGRAGRAEAGSQVILQTWNPQDPVFRFALQHDFLSFAKWELANRKELGYPPFQRAMALELQGKNLLELTNFSESLAEALQKGNGISVLGPADAFIAKIRDIYRKQILLKASTPQLLRDAGNVARNADTPKGIQVRIDMDPQGLL